VNRLLRKIFRPNREKVTTRLEKCFRLKNFVFCSPHQIYSNVQFKEDEMGVTRATYGGETNFMQAFGGKASSEEPHGRPDRGWKDSIQMESASGSGQVADFCKHCGEPLCTIKFGEFLGYVRNC
jgi:hypothetical protein